MDESYVEKILKARVYDVAIESPLEAAPRLSRRLANDVWFKREDLQPVFSFKLRGAYNKIASLGDEVARRGVICASAGNHAQGVALAARRRSIPAVIVMPRTTPEIKVQAVREFGAEVVLHGDDFDHAYEHALGIMNERGLTLIHPFDDPDVIAGQGTIGMEILRQHSGKLDAIFVPIGGGGLIAGVGLAIKAARPDVRVIGVQAEALPAMRRALEARSRVTLPSAPTIADGIAVRQVGELTLALASRCVDEVVTVTEEETANAILLLLEIEKTVVEGAGATPLAAILNRRLGLARRNVVLVLTGGNIDVTMISRIIVRGLVKDGRLVRFGVILRDQPGALARLTALIAECRANIVHIEHDRAFSHAAIGESRVELTLETAGAEQIAAVKQRLTEAGYGLEEPYS